MTAPRVTIEDVMRSDAGAHLFNAITRMSLRRPNGDPVLFSARHEITQRFIGMLLEGGLVPEDLSGPRSGR